MIKNLIIIVLVILIVITGFGWFAASVNEGLNVEACSVEEIRMHEDRDFLMELFQIASAVKGRSELYAALDKKYGEQVGVTKVDDGIIWGGLKILFNEDDEIINVREMTQDEFDALGKDEEKR